ncbi:MAG: NAD(P)-dependent oxidoreductase [Saprospiraceae bacterium]
MARILITGASGFIGGYLVALALERGDDVTATVRAGSDRSRLQDPRLQLLDLPLQDQDAMTTMLRGQGRFDWVVHNAGVTKALHREDYRRGNLDHTRRLVQALQAAENVPDKFLFVSSLAALGAAPAGVPLIRTEQTPQPLTSYGASKLDAERYLESLPADFPWVVVRPTAVYGPWERDILTFIRLMERGLELTIGRKPQRLSFVHAADMAQAVFRVLENPAALQSKYIIGDGREYQTADLGAAVRQALGKRKTLRLRLPLGLVRPVAGLAETIGRWQKKPSPLNREKIPELAAENWQCDVRPLFEELGFQPKYDLYSGMADTVGWYRENGWL